MPQLPRGSRAEGIRLPNGVELRPGHRVRVPAELIWHPEVLENCERFGWELDERAYSPGSEVLVWPA